MTRRTLEVSAETWPIAGRFTISRGSKTEAHVVVARIAESGKIGRGECVPYARYGETVYEVVHAISALRGAIEDGLTRAELQETLPAGAARNAIDCALVDLEAKRAGIPARELFDLPEARPVTTAYTISFGTPEEMAAAAALNRNRPLLKVKLGGPRDEARIAAVREAAPKAALIVDANEGWTEGLLAPLTAACLGAGVRLIEQPLPAGQDEALHGYVSPVPLCADESCHDRASLEGLAGKYQFINIKLDKTGGITEAVALARAARGQGFGLMLGCMVATSLAMAPLVMLSPWVQFVDLDGPLLLERDRPGGLRYEGALLYPPHPDLWG